MRADTDLYSDKIKFGALSKINLVQVDLSFGMFTALWPVAKVSLTTMRLSRVERDLTSELFVDAVSTKMTTSSFLEQRLDFDKIKEKSCLN